MSLGVRQVIIVVIAADEAAMGMTVVRFVVFVIVSVIIEIIGVVSAPVSQALPVKGPQKIRRSRRSAADPSFDLSTVNDNGP